MPFTSVERVIDALTCRVKRKDVGREFPGIGHRGFFSKLPTVNLLVGAVAALLLTHALSAAESNQVVDSTTIRHKVLCGYQGWFSCPGDGSNRGWGHWSNAGPLTTATGSVHVEYWPDMSELTPEERFAAPGYTYPDGKQAHLFSSHNPLTVLRHFQWMRQYGIDGVFLQRFVIGLPGAKGDVNYQERLDVLNNVRSAANQTGRVWAINYDTVSVPPAQVFDLLVTDWKKMVDWKVTDDPRYIHEAGCPVVHIWWNDSVKTMTPQVLNRLVDFFKAPGRYHAFIVAGGGHDWRKLPDREWVKAIERLDACVPWNAGNAFKDQAGVLHAQTNAWAGDREELAKHGTLWIPVVYSGFSWNNLQRLPWGKNTFPRRKGNFLWEQFRELSKMGGVDTVFLAMFDEVDEGTAILKVTNFPPTQANFLTYEGMPGDWYMRLVGLGEKLLREKTPVPEGIPIKP